MQAVILAAGKSTRTHPLTLTMPKPLLKAANKAILEHNLDNLNGLVDKVILIVGYKKDMLIKKFKNKYKNIKIRYVGQKQQLGTGHALLIAEKCIKNGFISLYGDDIYSKEDFENVFKNKYSVLVSRIDNPQSFGVVIEKNGLLVNLIEKPKHFVSNLVNTGLYKLDNKIFPIIKNLKKSERGEYEITDAIKHLAIKNKIKCVESKQWLPIGYPWDLLKADKILRKNRSVIGRNVKIKGRIINSTVGDDCIVNGIVKNSIVMDGSIIDSGSLVEDSIIGENVHFSGKIRSKEGAYSIVKGNRIKTERFGAVIGDNVKAQNVIINAGCKIWPYKRISNKTIKKDLM